MIDLNAFITDLNTIGTFQVLNIDDLENNKYHLDIVYVNVTETDKSVIDDIVGVYMGNMQINSLLESNTYKAEAFQL